MIDPLGAPGAVWCMAPFVAPEIATLRAEGIQTGYEIERTVTAAHLVAESLSRDPWDVVIYLAEIAGRGAIQTADATKFNGCDFDLWQSIAVQVKTDRAEAIERGGRRRDYIPQPHIGAHGWAGGTPRVLQLVRFPEKVVITADLATAQDVPN